MHESVLRLREVLRPPRRGGDRVDWDAVSAEVGFSFPSDYKDFMDVYGGGSIDYFLSIYSLDREFDDWRGEYESAPYMFYEDEHGLADPCPVPVQAGPGGLILWAISAGPDFCFWDATQSDPEEWPVLVFNRNLVDWFQYQGCMGDFLADVIKNQNRSIFGSSDFPSLRPDFLNGRDERLLYEAGVDVAYYYDSSPGKVRVFEQCRNAGLDPEDFFASTPKSL
jgi:hypothetical protein